MSVSKSWQEMCDRAVWMLVFRGVSDKKITETVGISAQGIKRAIQRVESGRYGRVSCDIPSPAESKR